VPSTVIAIADGKLRMLREGALSERALRMVLAETAVPNEQSTGLPDDD
jgi:tRNA A37 threonylcarbamoyladenosine synthetase subunit TsaC/SUA5/YrdC